ncbi:D-hexose-6-phosphate mutarotase [Thalassotalea sp. ND16A]|uniref:D-hexose-6-phosphate mutarotase n=1 Tax=Thalassotalea sp. ND16A TaxID=1535422 RepID=UPI00051A8015|nr:D-hexose-6-phosphate mutarotase [Thalassotalea sp. ND16A]KGJ89492.1 hypothetical protein ND16A_2385 [Thalassotalea sp. ND16A]
MKNKQLNQQKVLIDNEFGVIKKVNVNKDIEIISIEHRHCKAKLCLHGGHVLSWQPQGHEEVFWLSNDTAYQIGTAIRGGIPLCWPWFGSFKQAANHGFARTSVWQVEQLQMTAAGVRIELLLSGSEYAADWPYAFTVKQIITFADTFSQQLTVSNDGKSAFQFTDALHSYFNVSSPENVAIPDLSESIFDDKINQLSHCNGVDILDCVGPIDRIYHNDSSMTIVDNGAKRAIEISKTNSAQWVLWNPGVEIANNMADIHPQGEQEFVCLEAANTNWINLPAGETTVLSQQIRLHKL